MLWQRKKQEEFEKAALFPRLGLPSTLIRHVYGAFRKRSSQRDGFENTGLYFSCGRKTFQLKTELFENDGVTVIRWDFLDWVFPKTQIQNYNDCCVLKFFRRCVNRKHFIRFQIEPSIFKFLRPGMDETTLADPRWLNGLASRRKFLTWVFLRLCLARACVHLGWLALTLV